MGCLRSPATTRQTSTFRLELGFCRLGLGLWGAEIELPTMTRPAINRSTGTDSVPPAEGRWRLKKFVMGWESRWFEIDVAVADGEAEARLLRKNGGGKEGPQF
uniref:Uncharacterized protein n=1 Tax=Opuntia streptacantha TaxID=393608 RepID=A0A7C9CFH5_OPUST